LKQATSRDQWRQSIERTTSTSPLVHLLSPRFSRHTRGGRNMMAINRAAHIVAFHWDASARPVLKRRMEPESGIRSRGGRRQHVEALACSARLDFGSPRYDSRLMRSPPSSPMSGTRSGDGTPTMRGLRVLMHSTSAPTFPTVHCPAEPCRSSSRVSSRGSDRPRRAMHRFRAHSIAGLKQWWRSLPKDPLGSSPAQWAPFLLVGFLQSICDHPCSDHCRRQSLTA